MFLRKYVCLFVLKVFFVFKEICLFICFKGFLCF